MSSFNKVILIGNLTRDPELRQTPSGTSVCDIGLALNEKYKGKDGSDHEETVFVDVTAWGRQAETCGEYLQKGAQILVDGKLQFDQWESKEGEKRSKLRIRAERVQFLKTSAFKESHPVDAPNASDDSVPF